MATRRNAHSKQATSKRSVYVTRTIGQIQHDEKRARKAQARSMRASADAHNGHSGRGGRSISVRTTSPNTRARNASHARSSARSITARKSASNIVVALIIIGVVLVGAFALYLAPIATIQHISIKGAHHLTDEEMLALAQVPENTTLLRVDTTRIEQNCLRDAWIESVAINRIFPSTLEIVVTERSIAATVAVPTNDSTVTRIWAIAKDKTWLMPIPDKESVAAQTVSEQVYIDAESVLQIVDVPYGTTPEIGATCTDGSINNALAIVSGMTTELANSVVRVSATDAESTILTLDNGVEIAFGEAENIRDKERVCLALLEEHEGSIAYINVRNVSSPTWRSL